MPKTSVEVVVEANDVPAVGEQDESQPPPPQRQWIRGGEEEEELAGLDRTIPSSEYERRITHQLSLLLGMSKVNLREAAKFGRIAVEAVFFHQGAPVVVTFIMLLVTCVLYPSAQTITCTVLFFVLYIICLAMQVYLLWARITEKKARTAYVMDKVLTRWQQRVTAMARMPQQSQSERRAVFRECMAVLPARAFRMVAAASEDVLTAGRLKHVLKCVLVKGALRLDEAALVARRYTEPVFLCKLVDVMRITLESDAIVLRPLRDRARPPRLPNLHIAQNSVEEEEEEANTTDDSDQDHDPRTDFTGANSCSVSQKMEFLVHRLFLLAWVLGMLLAIAAGFFFYVYVTAPLGEGVFLYPAVALLGMLPVNAILLNRLLVMYANIYLDRLFHHLVSKTSHSLDDRIPRFSFLSTLQALQRVVWRYPGRHPLCFSSSVVESLGTATVVALLDTTGVVTDMVPLPIRLLMLKRNEDPESSSSSDDEGIVNAVNGSDNIFPAPVITTAATTNTTTSFLAEPSSGEAGRDDITSGILDRDAALEHKRELKKQVRRKKFQERRFLELQLHSSQWDELAVQFSDEKEFRQRQMNVNPVALCLLLHALAPEPTNLETWTEPFRFCDRTLRWARSIHWIPRASGFDDSLASTFCVIARVFQVNTTVRTGYRNDYPEQACTLLVEDENNVLHAFTVGTVHTVTHNCPFHFTGSSIEELDVEARAELVHLGRMVWEEGMGLETVALSHQLLPERYHSCARQLRVNNSNYREFFFRNGVHVTGNNTELDVVSAGENDRSSSNSRVSDSYNHVTQPQREQQAKEEEKSSTPVHKPENNVSNDDGSSIDSVTSLDILLDFLIGSSHSFLGLVGLRDSVRPNVQTAMSVLEGAGIRCMYFCADNERRTKSFGSRLGLETDWNCCISLKEGAVALDRHSIRAQLPVGIKSIRKHILHVDSIPLQVNMFSHANGASTRAMLSVLQDNHEVVVSIGSIFNHGNVRSFIQSDLSFGVLPTRRGTAAEKEEAQLRSHCRVVEPSDFNNITLNNSGIGMGGSSGGSLNRDLPLYRNVAELIACSCTLSAAPTSAILPIVTTLIRQARLRLSGIGNCVEFTMHANFLVTMVNLVALGTGAPLLISPTSSVFELNVIIPILALSCTYTAYADMDPMKTISSRHNYFVRLAIFRHSSFVWCLRYLPSLLALLLLGITCGVRMCDRPVLELSLSASDACMTSTRGYIALTLNYWLMIHSWTHMSRHETLSPDLSFKTRYGKRSMYLFKSFRWVFASVLATVLSLTFVVMDTARDGVTARAFYPSHVHFFASLFFPVLLLLLDVPIKMWRAERFSAMQKFRRLSFGTRLGMHSPRGDYEPEGFACSNNDNANSNNNDNSSGSNHSTVNSIPVVIDEAYDGVVNGAADVGSLGHSQRYWRHHTKLKASFLSSPDDRHFEEETLLIGSVGHRSGLLETVRSPNSEQGREFTSLQDDNDGDSLIFRSPQLSAGQSFVTLPEGVEIPDTPSLRSVTFIVRRSSKYGSGVDFPSINDGVLEQSLILDGTTNVKKKKKSVRFPENVIKSVSFLQTNDQLHLLVQYNRPWYAHLVLVIAIVFFVLHWGFIARVTYFSGVTGNLGVPAVISFVSFGFASAYLLVFLALSWRPDREERGYLLDFSRNRLAIYVLAAGVVAQLSLVCVFVFCVNVVGLVCFCSFPLILTYLYEEYKKHSVSVLDGVGCILVVCSIILFTIGARIEGGRAYARILTVVFGVVGGIAMSFFLFQLRTVSRHVSNRLVMTSTITLVTLVLGIVACAAGGFTTPIGKSHQALAEISSADFLAISLSALFLFFSWFAYHWSSLFFDRMTLSGSFSLGGPISILIFFLLSLPVATIPYEIAGGVTLLLGCALVLYSGYRFRQNVEVRIQLEEE